MCKYKFSAAVARKISYSYIYSKSHFSKISLFREALMTMTCCKKHLFLERIVAKLGRRIRNGNWEFENENGRQQKQELRKIQILNLLQITTITH